MPHAMAGNLYKAAFSIRFTSVSPEIETLLQDLTATTPLQRSYDNWLRGLDLFKNVPGGS